MVSNIFYFHPYLGKIPILIINIFQMGWNDQPARDISETGNGNENLNEEVIGRPLLIIWEYDDRCLGKGILP